MIRLWGGCPGNALGGGAIRWTSVFFGIMTLSRIGTEAKYSLLIPMNLL